MATKIRREHDQALQERDRFLERCHEAYRHTNQVAHESTTLMARLGHPFADDYRTLFGFWDRLRYASNYGERFVAYKDAHECVTWGQPDLEIDLNPKDYERHVAVFGVSSGCYGRMEHDDLTRYIHANADLGWPVEGGTTLDPGTIGITTRDYRLISQVYVIMQGKIDISRSDRYSSVREDDPAIAVRVRSPAPDARQTLLILAAVKRRMRKWMLPERAESDRDRDAAPLPMAQRRFTLAGVNEVTITNHQILIPLIPISTTGSVLAQRTANTLVNLCRWQGYPYDGEVRAWLEKFLTKSAMRKLDREFGHTSGVRA